MINPNEAEICKRRRHEESPTSGKGWLQCQWCGTWLRKVSRIEEREDDPPVEEQDQFWRMNKELQQEKQKLRK